VDVSADTIGRVRQRFVEEGLEAALVRKKQERPSRGRALDGRAEARLIALACSAPPTGRKAWTLRLLADRLVELEVVETVSHETVRRVLKKTNSSRT
jgi:transposase